MRTHTAFLTAVLALGAFAFLSHRALTSANSLAPSPQEGGDSARRPWMNPALSPDQRADMVLKQLTPDEKIALLHGNGMAHVSQWQMPLTPLANGGAGYVQGVARLGIPGLAITDAAYGVRSSGDNGRYSTALPSNLGMASSWDPEGAYKYGTLIGREVRAQGFNMSLGGGTNLTREPRNGRTFEYQGEDPVLAGTLVGNLIKGVQAQHVVANLKHYALNDQETGRDFVNAVISKRALRESDLLAFQIGLQISDAAAFMCSYNRVNGDYACENSYLLSEVLKGEWKFKGFVLSDWGGTHSTAKASAAGLDQEQPMGDFFGDALKQAVLNGTVPASEIDDHVRRILRSEFASGIVDHPVQTAVVDVEGGLDLAQRFEEQSIVLLRNQNAILPLDARKLQSLAVIGAHADVGMISGGGSAQVDPPGGNAIAPPGQGATTWQAHIWFPTSPLKALRAKLPQSKVEFDSGEDPSTAATLAKNSDAAVIFVHQWESEGVDSPTLSLPDNQDALIAQVAAANPHTIVVLETGGPVTMPWAGKVSGIVEAWYAGSRGSVAVTNVLFGDVNPTGKLAVTFPRSDSDLPHPTIPPIPVAPTPVNSTDAPRHPAYSVTYDEGLKVGYKWYDAENKPVLFPFGYGLSYTTYRYSGLKMTADAKAASFTVTNTGKRAGAEIAQVYVSLPAAAQEPPKRLVGWVKVKLNPSESKNLNVEINPQYLQVFDEHQNAWQRVPGQYTFAVGGSSQDLPIRDKINLP
jgi:beta-glucosidase